MDIITCDVIKDLLPLYVDDVLSADSKTLVDEHLSSCKKCSDYHNKMKSPEKQDTCAISEDKKALKLIRKQLITRRLITILITVICVAALLGGLFYGIVVHEKYIPYEETGLYVSDEALRTNREYYKSVGIYTPDGETLFIYMTTTAFIDLTDDGERLLAGNPVVGLTDVELTTKLMDAVGIITEEHCKEIYYISEEKARQLLKELKSSKKNVWASWDIEELKKASVLVWSD